MCLAANEQDKQAGKVVRFMSHVGQGALSASDGAEMRGTRQNFSVLQGTSAVYKLTETQGTHTSRQYEGRGRAWSATLPNCLPVAAFRNGSPNKLASSHATDRGSATTSETNRR